MLLGERWAILMAEIVGVFRREVGYLKGRTDRCCWETFGLS